MADGQHHQLSRKEPCSLSHPLCEFLFLGPGGCFHLHFKIISDLNLFFLYAICCPFGLPVLFFTQILYTFSPVHHFLFLPYYYFILISCLL